MFRDSFPQVPIMALTATATPRVSKDIIKQLGMRDPIIFSALFNRPNLRYHVLPKRKDVVSAMAERLMQKHTDAYSLVQPGIVYCLSRADCERVADQLNVRLLQHVCTGDFPTCTSVLFPFRCVWHDGCMM